MRRTLGAFACIALAATSLAGLAVAQEPSSSGTPSSEPPASSLTPVSSSGAPAKSPTAGPSHPIALECREHTKEIKLIIDGAKARLAAQENGLGADATSTAALHDLHEQATKEILKALDDAGLHRCLEIAKQIRDAKAADPSIQPKPTQPAPDDGARAIMVKCEARVRAFLTENMPALPTARPATAVASAHPIAVRAALSLDGPNVAEDGEANDDATQTADDHGDTAVGSALRDQLEQLKRACAEELRGYFQEHKGDHTDALRGSDAYPAALADGKIGAEVALKDGKATTTPMQDGFTVRDAKLAGKRFTATIDSTDHAGKTVVFQVEPGALSEARKLAVHVMDVADSGAETAMEVHMASSLEDVLDPTDDGSNVVEFWVIKDLNGIQVMLSIPHYSEKRVEVAADDSAAIGSPVPGFEAVLGLAALGVATIVIGRRN